MKLAIVATAFAALVSAAPAAPNAGEKSCIMDGAAKWDRLEWAKRRYRYEGFFVSDGGDPGRHADRFCDHWKNIKGHTARNPTNPQCWRDPNDLRHFYADISFDDVVDNWSNYKNWVQTTADTFNNLKFDGGPRCTMNTGM